MSIALYVLLGLSVLIDLALGAWASVSWKTFVSAWNLGFNVSEAGDAQLLGLVLGLALLYFAVLQGVAFRWIRAEKEEGHWIVISFGFYLIVSSLITFLVFRHRVEFLLVDGVRGALLAVFSAVVLRAPATVKELRLPDRALRDARRERSVRDTRRRPSRRGERSRGDRSREERSRGGRTRNGTVRGRSRRSESPATTATARSEPDRQGAARPDAKSGRRRRRDRPRRDRNEVAAMETREENGDLWSRTEEDRLPAAEEMIASETIFPKRPRTGDASERPLTVVVKGDPESLRVRPMDDSGGTEEAGTQPALDSSEEGSSSHERRRRRRRQPRSRRREERSAEDAESPPGGERKSSPAEGAGGRRDRPEARGAGAGPARSSGVVEALDLLSLLEPASKRTADSSDPYGRRGKHIRRRPSHGSAASSESSPEAETSGGRGESSGSSSHDSNTRGSDGHPPGREDLD